MTVTRWKCIVEYDCAGFHGWQIQEPGLPTVQGALEKALYAFCQKDIRIHAAGRTDTGVHARHQVIHFDLDYGDRALSGAALAKALNAHLINMSVSVIHAESVSDTFHARFDAKNKLYVYRILNRPSRPALEEGKFWHVKRSLNVKNMQSAAKLLCGTHDFTSFRATECQAKSPIRTVEQLEIIEKDYDPYGGKLVELHFEAQSFLHHMVRNITGTLKIVGDGRWTADDVAKALKECKREAGGPTAPPEGLTLERIDYL